jgi:probable phosphoglycerate mutase
MIPATPFYMIRHGETEMNAKRLTCGGGVDTILNDEGRRQAYVAARVLGSLAPEQRPTLIIHSNMKRTVETTNILNAELNLPVLYDHDLREHMMGEWEQQPWDEVYPFLHGDPTHQPKGGESRQEFGARIRDALARNLSAHASERVMFVAHGGVFHSFQFIHGRPRHIFIPNATLHRFEPEPAHEPMPWRVTLYEWKNALRESAAPICPSQAEPDQ